MTNNPKSPIEDISTSHQLDAVLSVSSGQEYEIISVDSEASPSVHAQDPINVVGGEHSVHQDTAPVACTTSPLTVSPYSLSTSPPCASSSPEASILTNPQQTVPEVSITSPTTISPYSLAASLPCSLETPEPLTGSHINTCTSISKELREQIIFDSALATTVRYTASGRMQLYNIPEAAANLQLRHRKAANETPVSPISSEDSKSTSVCSCFTHLYRSVLNRIQAAFRPTPTRYDNGQASNLNLDL